MITIRFIALCLLVSVFATTSTADNWPRFRGPNGSGVAESASIPTKWTQSDLAWKTQLPGTGHSSPVVWGGNVYVTSASEKGDLYSLLAYRATDGKLVWKNDQSLNYLRVHSLNSRATSTPAADKNGVYALWFGPDKSLVVAVDHDGTERWQRNLGPTATMHGPSQSPMVHNGMLIFSFEQELNKAKLRSYWYALDCKTGETVWRLERDVSEKASSSVPCIYRTADGADQIVFSSNAHGLTAIDPRSGAVAWCEPTAFPTRVVSSPVQAGDLLVGTNGRRGGGLRLVAIDPGGDTPTIVHDLEDKTVPYVSSPIAHGELLFLFHDSGLVTCMDIASGEVRWSERQKGKFFGSPVLVDDRLYCITNQGSVFVLRAAAEYELLSMNDLGEGSQATPAVANGRMFLRTHTHLMCVAAPNGQ
jgi:outer membrane protein assembly factor BamB